MLHPADSIQRVFLLYTCHETPYIKYLSDLPQIEDS